MKSPNSKLKKTRVLESKLSTKRCFEATKKRPEDLEKIHHSLLTIRSTSVEAYLAGIFCKGVPRNLKGGSGVQFKAKPAGSDKLPVCVSHTIRNIVSQSHKQPFYSISAYSSAIT